MKTMLMRVLLAGCFVVGVAVAADGPKMPPPAAPRPGGQPNQPSPEQIKQAEREHQRRKNTKPRKGNEQQPFGGGDKKDKEEDKKLEITGVLEKKAGSPGEPETFTVKDGEGTTYTLDGKETTLRRLVGKSVELEGERDEKSGALKVKSVREAKAAIGKDKKS